MTMQLRIVHSTTFEYDGLATASYNQARMTPRNTPHQIVAHTRLEVSPTPWTYSYEDYWGTKVTSFEVLDPHASLTVVATCTVHTFRPPTPEPRLTWDELRSAAAGDRWTEYLTLTPRVQPPPDLTDLVRELAAGSALPGEAARAVCGLIHDQVEYRTDSTHVRSHASDAWAQRAGVCQDMAHLVIGGLRSLGIPARYVSGYLHPRREPMIGESVRGESHAWVEWWDDGWHPFDPTNNREPHDRYVLVATGRDYRDVRPLSGIYTGAGTQRMQVDVHVTRLA